ncbi:MAG: glycosyltransferase family 2 protein [Pseudomonadales bacterium]|nr:glycosyltransferase family 2 protein [Pseudomonadales bacterium]
MNAKIDLVWLGDSPPPLWTLGAIHTVAAEPIHIAELIRSKLADSSADVWLFWHSRLGTPDAEVMARVIQLPGNVWHAGLRLGLAGLPGIIDFIVGTWTLNRDPDEMIEATSWRLSLEACLITTDVLRQMGGPRPEFTTLVAASLELGHRYITRGVITRHIPWMLPEKISKQFTTLPFIDEVRFAYYRFGKGHTYWALLRAILSGYASLITAWKSWQAVRGSARPKQTIYKHPALAGDSPPMQSAKVSVLIPTVDRYPYLRKLLEQLRTQTVKPHEIIVVDQTQAARRDLTLGADYKDLPLKIINQDEPGQCTSRNAGLQASTGDFILFIDDDDEVSNDLLELHLKNLARFKVQVSSGAADEIGAGPLPENFTFIRVSDVFPTNNTMIYREVLRASGMFDLAYNRRQRADGDLGTRIYLSGTLMILNPEIRVLHHHAPSGGLRVHKARVVTYASSRQHLFIRHLPAVSEIYLTRRYFTDRQVYENLWLRAFGTYSIRGGLGRKLLKALASTLLLPNTVWKIRQRRNEAEELLKTFPQIPALDAQEQVQSVGVGGKS